MWAGEELGAGVHDGAHEGVAGGGALNYAAVEEMLVVLILEERGGGTVRGRVTGQS